jgi:carotenoid cleavage dioxygenase-like enzyme
MTTHAEPHQELPFHLRGNFAPVREEVTAFDLPVEGTIPPEMTGLYLRNGPNPRSGSSPHWFLGDGMLHGVRLEQGRAAWYRNRFVRTRTLTEPGAERVRPDGTVDLTVGLANTSVVSHAGRILALVESSLPTRVTPELDTLGPFDFEGRLERPMTAHPKLCPRSGEMHFFGYHFAPPFLSYHRVDAAGRLVQSEAIEVPGPTMIHDFAITEHHVVFMDLPIVFSPGLLAEGRFPFAWSDDYGARVGVMPRGARGEQVRWFEVEPCYVFHPLNAFDEAETVVVDVVRYRELWRGGPEAFAPAHLHRWALDLHTGKVREQDLDDRSIEFPRVDERRTGLPHRFGYALSNERGVGEEPRYVLKYDLLTGRTEMHDFGPGRVPSELAFVPSGPHAAEDEGWLVGYVYDAPRQASDFVVLDASRPAAPPLATVPLPQRVPFGFHGSWLPDPV